jgi:predicted TIM-barrel fold metal-dependent hydrolase
MANTPPVEQATFQPHRIDIHHHIYPPAYFTKAAEHIRSVTHAFYPRLLEWTPSKALEVMDRDGIATAIVSISAPGIWFGDAAAAAALARECNDYAAQMARDHKGRFGLFAILPLGDVERSLREIEYAYDVLKADGIALMTNCLDLWPGDAAFAPVFDALNERKAVVYFHPTAASFLSKVLPEIPAPTVEFPFDTTRAILSLLFSGTTSRCPDIRFIFSHGGGALPMVAGRMVGLAGVRKELGARIPNGVMAELKRFYYDIASVTNRAAFNAIRDLVGISQLLFGSDYPFWSPDLAISGLRDMGLDADGLAAIERTNALQLLPKLPQ